MQVALITGCSSGFGRVAALAFIRAGYRVYATVRGVPALETLAAAGAGPELHPVELEVTDSAAVARLVNRIMKQDGRIDVLVNNAGIARPGTIEDLKPHDMEQVMAVNFMAPLLLSRQVLPHMRAGGGGHIIMVSSLSALVGLPGEGMYAASKAALETASESMRHEVARFNIAVSVIEPGHFNTGMPARILEQLEPPAGSVYVPLLAHLREHARRGTGGGDDPQRVAELLLRIVATPRPSFRYPAGDQARQVVARLPALHDADRDRFIAGVNDTGWWSAGEPAPE